MVLQSVACECHPHVYLVDGPHPLNPCIDLGVEAQAAEKVGGPFLIAGPLRHLGLSPRFVDCLLTLRRAESAFPQRSPATFVSSTRPASVMSLPRNSDTNVAWQILSNRVGRTMTAGEPMTSLKSVMPAALQI